jgi:hypothetical protein
MTWQTAPSPPIATAADVHPAFAEGLDLGLRGEVLVEDLD